MDGKGSLRDRQKQQEKIDKSNNKMSSNPRPQHWLNYEQAVEMQQKLTERDPPPERVSILGVRNYFTKYYTASATAEVGIANATTGGELAPKGDEGDLIIKKNLRLVGEEEEGGLNGSTITIFDNLCKKCYFYDDWDRFMRLLAEVKTEVRLEKVEGDLSDHKDETKAQFDNMQIQLDEMRNSFHGSNDGEVDDGEQVRRQEDDLDGSNEDATGQEDKNKKVSTKKKIPLLIKYKRDWV